MTKSAKHVAAACIHVALPIAGAASPHLTIAGYEATIHEHQTPLEVKITYHTHIVHGILLFLDNAKTHLSFKQGCLPPIDSTT